MVHLLAVLASVALTGLFPSAAAASSSPSLAAMKGQDRVLLVFAPGEADAALQTQREIMTRFAAGAADRDLRIVEVVADRVTGAGDAGDALRRRYRIMPGAFAALLIGKDGHVALRQPRPLTAETLSAAIDAMPMRRAELARRGR